MTTKFYHQLHKNADFHKTKTFNMILDRGRWKRLDDDQDGGWVSVSSGTGSSGQSRTKGRETVVVVRDDD